MVLSNAQRNVKPLFQKACLIKPSSMISKKRSAPISSHQCESYLSQGRQGFVDVCGLDQSVVWLLSWRWAQTPPSHTGSGYCETTHSVPSSQGEQQVARELTRERLFLAVGSQPYCYWHDLVGLPLFCFWLSQSFYSFLHFHHVQNAVLGLHLDVGQPRHRDGLSLGPYL